MANKKKVFISYDYDNDKHYKNLMLAWDQNKTFDFYISDYSADVGINSTRAPTVKSVLSRYINKATVLLVIVGKKTYKSDWVRWEISKAFELGKKIVAVKIDKENNTPPELYNIGASWAMSFTLASIITAINK